MYLFFLISIVYTVLCAVLSFIYIRKNGREYLLLGRYYDNKLKADSEAERKLNPFDENEKEIENETDRMIEEHKRSEKERQIYNRMLKGIKKNYVEFITMLITTFI